MNPLIILWRMVSYHRKMLPVCCGIIMFVSGLAVVIPLYTKFVLEYILSEKASELLNYSIIFFLVIVIVRFIFSLLQDLAVVILRQKVESTYNKQYIDAIFRLKSSAFQNYKKGDLIARFRVFINDIEWFLCDFLFFVFYALFVFVFLSIAMAIINLPLFLLVLAFTPLHYYNFKYFISPLKKASQSQEEAKSQLTSFTLQSVDSWNDIRNYFLQKRFIDINSSMINMLGLATFSRKRSGLQQQHLQAVLIIVNHIAIITFGGYQITQGDSNVGTIFFFLLLLDFFYSPIYRFSAVNESLQAAGHKIQRMADIINHDALEEAVPITANKSELTKPLVVETLALKNLSYGELFKSLDFTFSKGNVYFISGASGCGKSTLLNLLTRLIDVDNGQISINEESTQAWPAYKLREHIQCALQDSQLFSSTISRNIHLGPPGSYDEQRVKRAAYHAVADEFIEKLPHKYNTIVNEQGDNFSGGQQQRLNLARLFYHNPPVMLFDEPTSALDAATEQFFFERLHQLKDNKIIIVVNHRSHNTAYADQHLELTPTGLYPVSQTAGQQKEGSKNA